MKCNAITAINGIRKYSKVTDQRYLLPYAKYSMHDLYRSRLWCCCWRLFLKEQYIDGSGVNAIDTDQLHVPSQSLVLEWQVVSGRSWILAGTVSVSVLLDVVRPLPRLAASWTQRGHSECQSAGVAVAHVMRLTSAAV